LMRIFGSVPRNAMRVVLGACPLALCLGFYQVAITVFLPLEGVSVTDLGVLLTTSALSSVIFSIPFAVLSDRHGRRRIMLIGSFLAACISVIPGITTRFLVLEASAVIGGIGDAMFLSTWNAYLADSTTEDTRSSTFSLSFMTFTVMSGIGSAIPGLFPFLPLSLDLAHRVFFIALGVLALLTPYSVFRWVGGMKPEFSRQGILPRKSLGIIAKFSAANLLIGLGAGLIIPLIPTWFYLRFSVTDVFSGPLIAVSNIMMGFAAGFSPRISKRFGQVGGIVLTQLLSTVFMIAMPLSLSAEMAASLYVIRSTLMNMSSPLSDTFIMNLIAEDERATASSFNVAMWGLPNAASTVVGGSLLSGGNLSLPFYLCAGLYMVSVLLFYSLFHKLSS
jgi:MFS family permease